MAMRPRLCECFTILRRFLVDYFRTLFHVLTSTFAVFLLELIYTSIHVELTTFFSPPFSSIAEKEMREISLQ